MSMDVQTFYRTLWQDIPAAVVNLRLIPEGQGYPLDIFRSVAYMLDLPPDSIPYLHGMNDTHHIYHRVGVSRTAQDGKSHIHALPALWCDVDDDSTAAYHRLTGLLYPPTMVIASGGGYHGYWLLKDPLLVTNDNRDQIERTLEGIAIATDGDTTVKNVNRILRTPGFVNIKKKYDTPPTARVLYCDEDRYTFSMLEREFAPLGAPPSLRITRHIPREALSRSVPNRVRDYLTRGAHKGNRNNELYYCARAYLDAGYSQTEASYDLTPRAQMDGLRDDEIQRTIASAYRNQPNPTASLPSHMTTLMAIEDSRGGQS